MFESEYQIQLVINLMVGFFFHLIVSAFQINTCDGFLLGAVLTAINAALTNTRYPTLSVQLTDSDDEQETVRSGTTGRKSQVESLISRQLMERKSKFRHDMDDMKTIQVEDELCYCGFLVYNVEEVRG